MAACLLVLPIVVYMALYVPWAMPWQPQTAADRSLPVLYCFDTDANGQCLNSAWPSGHTGQTLMGSDDRHVQLPQRPARPARGVVAVVGLADGPQAGLVRERPLRRRQRHDDLRRRQPGRSWWLAIFAMAFVSLAGLQAAQPGPDADRRGLLLAVAVVVPHRPGRVPVPLLHRPALLPGGRWPTSWRSCGTARRAGRGCWPESRRPVPCSSRPLPGWSRARCAGWPGSSHDRLLGQTRSAATGPATFGSRQRMFLIARRPGGRAGRPGPGPVAPRATPEAGQEDRAWIVQLLAPVVVAGVLLWWLGQNGSRDVSSSAGARRPTAIVAGAVAGAGHPGPRSS